MILLLRTTSYFEVYDPAAVVGTFPRFLEAVVTYSTAAALGAFCLYTEGLIQFIIQGYIYVGLSCTYPQALLCCNYSRIVYISRESAEEDAGKIQKHET